MSEIGIMGAGKLGLPVGLAMESKGHNVTFYDISPLPEQYLTERQLPYVEEGLQPLLDKTQAKFAKNVGELVATSDILFLPVQTPHQPEFEGSTRIPEARQDFDYTYLLAAIGNVALEARLQEKHTTLAVISTCLPGTFKRDIEPRLNEYVDYVYTPQFIAMGTVLKDYLHPEFNLIGVHNPEAAEKLETFYDTINDAPNVVTDVTTAEAIKVSYNTFITMKTVLANAWGEMAHKTGANYDDILKAWSMSGRRLLSPRYLDSGMGDGGGCHPRDNIALSWLANEVGMSHNLWEDLMEAREDHADWLAQLCIEKTEETGLPLVILGRSFKPETNIETGSPAILVGNLVSERNVEVTQVEDLDDLQPAVYFIGTNHDRYKDYKIPSGSVVIDPFRKQPDRDGVTTIRIGE